MTNKKKLLIIATAICAFIFVGLITTIIVLVATSNQQAQSNLSIKYQATDVLAKMQATYYINGTEKIKMTDTDGINTEIEFNATVSSGTLSPNTSIELTKAKNRVVFEYIFTNLSGTEEYSAEIPMSVAITSLPNYSNVNIYYYSTATEVKFVDFFEVLPFIESSPLNVSHNVSTNSTKYIYVLVEVDDILLDASLEGSLQWTLSRSTDNTSDAITVLDAEADTYTNDIMRIQGDDSVVVTLNMGNSTSTASVQPLSTTTYAVDSSKLSVRIVSDQTVTVSSPTISGNTVSYTITKDSSIKEKFGALFAFDYNGEGSFIVIVFIDVEVEFELDNADDIYYGLQQERVFGVWSLGAGSTSSSIVEDRTYTMKYTKTADTEDYVSWESSDTSIATVSSSGVVTFKTATNFSGKKYVTIGAYSNDKFGRCILDEYTFTLVGGCNIWDAEDFYILDGKSYRSVMVLQTSLGVSDNDRVLTKPGATTYRPCDTTFALNDGVADYLQETIYGNGFVINFGNSTDTFGFSQDQAVKACIYNTVIRGHELGSDYTLELSFANRIAQYCVFERLKFVYCNVSSDSGWGVDSTTGSGMFNNCLFRDTSGYGLFINDSNYYPVYVEDCVFQNTGMAAIFFAPEASTAPDSRLYINGSFQCDNYNSVSDYDSTYQNVIKQVLTNNPDYSSTPSDPTSGTFNAVILRADDVALSSLKSLTEDLYFGGVLFTDSSADTSSVGIDFDMLTGDYSGLFGLIKASAQIISNKTTETTFWSYSTLFADFNKFKTAGHSDTETFMTLGQGNLALYS